jgi:hypothetical protein
METSIINAPITQTIILCVVGSIGAAILTWYLRRKDKDLEIKREEEFHKREIEREERQNKRADKYRLFSTLIMERHSPWTFDSIRAYNLIDVIFFDDTEVIQAWEQLHGIFGEPFDDNAVTQKRVRIENATLDLLFAMSKSLNYDINLTCLRRKYSPMGPQDERELSSGLQKSLIEFLGTAMDWMAENKLPKSDVSKTGAENSKGE